MKNYLLLALFCLTLLCSCMVSGVEKRYTLPSSGEEMRINSRVNGMNLTCYVYINEEEVMTHTFPPFVNSTEEKTITYKGHKVRTIFKMIKGFGNSLVQAYVFVDGNLASEFYF